LIFDVLINFSHLALKNIDNEPDLQQYSIELKNFFCILSFVFSFTLDPVFDEINLVIRDQKKPLIYVANGMIAMVFYN
jgi:hypothetical protein